MAVAVAGYGCYYFQVRGHAPIVRQTVAIKNLAHQIEQRGGKEFPLIHVDDPMGLQVYLNTLRPPVSFERAAELLRDGPPAFVAVNDLAKLQAQAGSRGFRLVPTPDQIA